MERIDSVNANPRFTPENIEAFIEYITGYIQHDPWIEVDLAEYEQTFEDARNGNSTSQLLLFWIVQLQTARDQKLINFLKEYPQFSHMVNLYKG